MHADHSYLAPQCALSDMHNRTVNQRRVKASGGIRDAQAAQSMIEAGASRLGLSGSAAVLDGFTA